MTELKVGPSHHSIKESCMKLPALLSVLLLTTPAIAQTRYARDLLNNIGMDGSLTDVSPAQYAAAVDLTHVAFLRGNYVSFNGTVTSSQLANMLAIRNAQMTWRKVRFGALAMAYINDPSLWAAQSPLFQAMLGAGVLKFIEGPNEINNPSTGNGSRGPNDLTNKTSATLFPANIQDWMTNLVAFKAANASAFEAFGTTLVGPSVAPIIGTEADYPVNGSVALSSAVDYCNLHYYAGSGRQPSLPYGVADGLGYFGNVYQWATKAYGAGLQCIVTEVGASTNGIQYDASGVSQAEYLANQLAEAWKINAAGVSIYQAFDGDTTPTNTDVEAHFGLFNSDHITPKPAATMLGRIADILSLGNSFASYNNSHDTAQFKPGINANNIAFTGLTSPPTSDPTSQFPGELTIYKSDGSSLLMVWNEPQIDTGTSPAKTITPSPDPVTLYLPRARNWRIHDPMASDSLTGKYTTSDTVTLSLSGHPMFVEVSAPSGYNQLTGDPADVPLFGSSTFALNNSTQNFAPNYGGKQPDALSVALTPPTGKLWTPGNVAVVFVTTASASLPTVAGATAVYGPYTFAGCNESVTVFTVPITNAHQQINVANTGSFAQAALYEVPPFTSASASAMEGSVSSTSDISGSLAAVPAGGIGLFYVGMGTTYSVQPAAQSSDTSVAILQQKQDGVGSNTYNTGFSGTVAGGRAAGAVTWQTPDYSIASTQPIIVTFSVAK